MSGALPFRLDEVVALVRPAVDAHTLGISYVSNLIEDCGYRALIADEVITEALNQLELPGRFERVRRWIIEQHVTRLGLSYRLDPGEAVNVLGRLHYQISEAHLFSAQGGVLRALYFAGLPPACSLVRERFGDSIITFSGDETASETLSRLGVPDHRQPKQLTTSSVYDQRRLEFGMELIESDAYRAEVRVDRSDSPGFGTERERVVDRVAHGRRKGLPPLMRVHAGPYSADRTSALKEFNHWTSQLANTGLLDVLSIGTSQLTQSDFGLDWAGRPNGGGVPVNTELEYRAIAAAARPMFTRTYAGTRELPALARLHERSLNIAWHALSFWWFSQLDGRGPNDVLKNLIEHHQVLDFVAETDKPFEPNIPHHFAFRGGDDVTYVLSGYLAARSAKQRGVRTLILQIMLNTPKYTLGVQDLAKARAILALVRSLEDENFHVLLQPRAGLDYFSPDLHKARVQLAAVSALMADIDPLGPDIVHVVSYTEAVRLADPVVINESIQITRAALRAYPAQRSRLEIAQVLAQGRVEERTTALLEDVRSRLVAMELAIPDLYSPLGLYLAFAAGYLAAPAIWGCREEFGAARAFSTRVIDGGVRLTDAAGRLLTTSTHLAAATQQLALIDRPALARRAAQLATPIKTKVAADITT